MHRFRRMKQQGGRRLSLFALVSLTFLAGVIAGGGAPFAGADNSLQNSDAYQTFEEAWAIIQRYQLEPEVPPAIMAHLRRGLAGELPETPKADAPIWQRVHSVHDLRGQRGEQGVEIVHGFALAVVAAHVVLH